MKTVYERLRFAREKAGFDKAADFARAHGFTESSYRGHENGSRGLKPPVAKIYANLLNVDFAWLMTGEGQRPTNQEVRLLGGKLQLAPLISWVQAGKLSTADSIDFDAVEHVVPIAYEHGRLVALEVRGSSMNNEAPPGSIIVVDYDQRHPYDGMLCLARVEDEVTFKRYRDKGGVIRLEPDSTDDHDTIFPSGDWEILGRVIWVAKRT